MKASVHERTPVNGCSVCVWCWAARSAGRDYQKQHPCPDVLQQRSSTINSQCVCLCVSTRLYPCSSLQTTFAACKLPRIPVIQPSCSPPQTMDPCADSLVTAERERVFCTCRSITHTTGASPPNTRLQPGNRWPVCRAVTTDTSSHCVRLTDCLQQSALCSTERVVSIDGRTHEVCVYLTEKFTSPMNIAIHWLAKAALSRTNRTDGRTDRRISMTVGRY